MFLTQARKRQMGGPLTQSVQVGSDMTCERLDDPCNGPLTPGADYGVRYQLFSGNQSSDFPFSDVIFSTSNVPLPLAFILRWIHRL